MLLDPIFGLKVNALFFLLLFGLLSALIGLIRIFIWTIRRRSDPNSLRTASRFMARASLLGAAVFPLLIALVFLIPNEMNGLDFTPDHYLRSMSETIPLYNRGLALSFYLIPTSFIVWALYALHNTFALYAQGEVFSGPGTRALTAVAAGLFGSVIARFLVRPPISWFLTMSNPPRLRGFSIGIGDTDVATLFWAGVILVIALVMREAQRTADENARFV